MLKSPEGAADDSCPLVAAKEQECRVGRGPEYAVCARQALRGCGAAKGVDVVRLLEEVLFLFVALFKSFPLKQVSAEVALWDWSFGKSRFMF